MTRQESGTTLTPPVIEIAQLVRVAAQIRMPDGSVHDVRRPNAAVFELIVAIEALPPLEQVRSLFEIVQQLVPSLSPEQVRTFDIDQAKAILKLATSAVDEVRKGFPPVRGPAKPRKRR
jgi:hypothetical protein